MRVLLDTHALIWWSLDDERLSQAARAAIAHDENTVFVSAASAWEIATKARIGKLPEAEELASMLVAYVASQGFTPLPITLSHGQRAGALPGPHRDPFDRMFIAQAQAENLPIVSNEVAFDGYGVVRVW